LKKINELGANFDVSKAKKLMNRLPQVNKLVLQEILLHLKRYL